MNAERHLRLANEFDAPADPSLPSSTSGGDNGGMDRLGHLEQRVDAIDGRLGRIESDVATLKSDLGSIRVTLASMDAKMDIAGVRSSVEKAHTDIYKWIVSIIAVVGAIYFGIQKATPSPQSPSTSTGSSQSSTHGRQTQAPADKQ